jgi:hypothetical protein
MFSSLIVVLNLLLYITDYQLIYIYIYIIHNFVFVSHIYAMSEKRKEHTSFIYQNGMGSCKMREKKEESSTCMCLTLTLI